jgi:hypothetical protein
VAFRETISEPEPVTDQAVTKWGVRKRLSSSPLVEDTTPDGRCTVHVRVVRLPAGITTVLDDNVELLRGILTEEGGLNVGRRRGGVDSAGNEEEDPVLVLRERLLSAAAEADAESEGSDAGPDAKPGVLDGRGLTWRTLLERVWGLGPRGVGPNLLLVPEVWRPEVGRLPGGREEGKEGGGEVRHARSPSPAVSAGLERGVLVTEQPTVSGRLGLSSSGKPRLEDGKASRSSDSTEKAVSSNLDSYMKMVGNGTGLDDSEKDDGGSTGPGFVESSNHRERALSEEERSSVSPGPADRGLSLQELAESAVSSVVNGFQLATAAGPLCEEPLWGLGFIVEAVVKPEQVKSGEGETEERSLAGHGPFSGQVITTVREACRKAVLAANPRLAEAMYLCEVSTTAEALGQVRKRVNFEGA